uniref:Secreted protein n=1 Tax=Parascaris univalens TaxID=6257 RepID=A0A915CJJ1_PARUN
MVIVWLLRRSYVRLSNTAVIIVVNVANAEFLNTSKRVFRSVKQFRVSLLIALKCKLTSTNRADISTIAEAENLATSSEFNGAESWKFLKE